jgi:hypothetical protein
MKLWLAATTMGTNDVGFWRVFADRIRVLGPIDVYGTHLREPYNHPPLTSWFLALANVITAHGISLPFLIRAPASVADLVTALLVFELVRRFRTLRQATVAGLTVAITPVLIAISGFHGNTDPVFVMFILLSTYLVIRERTFLAGMSAAAAVSVKIVPAVALPVLAAAMWRDRRRLIRAAFGFVIVLVPLWAPPVLFQWAGFKRNVLEYGGLNLTGSRWGLADFARNLHQLGLVNVLVGPGRFIPVAIAALLPAYFVRRRPDLVAVGVAMSLAIMLLCTPWFGMQYISWAAAAVVLLDVWLGLAFNVAAGAFVIVVYTHWTRGWPWDRAFATRFTIGQERLGWLVWCILLVCIVRGVQCLCEAAPSVLRPAKVIDLEAAATDSMVVVSQ